MLAAGMMASLTTTIAEAQAQDDNMAAFRSKSKKTTFFFVV